ncbi:hypothetical protein D3C77_514710 [compost metagenome]
MKKIRGVAALIVLLTFLFIGGYIYCMFNGTPWGKYTFRKQAEEYMEKTFPNEVIVEIEDRYSFKEMDYRTRFYTKSGQIITISLDHNGQLESDTSQ